MYRTTLRKQKNMKTVRYTWLPTTDMEFEEYFKKHFHRQLVPTSDEDIQEAEDILEFTFGERTRWLLKTFGSVAYKSIETYGVTNLFGLGSMLVFATLDLRERTNKLDKMAVFTQTSDAYAFCVDEKDDIYTYSVWDDMLTPMGTDIVSYLIDQTEPPESVPKRHAGKKHSKAKRN